MVRAGCVFVAGIHVNVRIFWVRAQTRPRFILSSEGVLGGMEFEPMLTPREDRTRDAVDSEPKHYQLSYSGPRTFFKTFLFYFILFYFILLVGTQPFFKPFYFILLVGTQSSWMTVTVLKLSLPELVGWLFLFFVCLLEGGGGVRGVFCIVLFCFYFFVPFLFS